MADLDTIIKSVARASEPIQSINEQQDKQIND